MKILIASLLLAANAMAAQVAQNNPLIVICAEQNQTFTGYMVRVKAGKIHIQQKIGDNAVRPITIESADDCYIEPNYLAHPSAN
jgi:hypothetical protein